MRWLVLILAATAALVITAYVSAGNPSSVQKLQTRVGKLEKLTRGFQNEIKSLTAQNTAMEIRFENAVQAESNLEARVTKLEEQVFHQGN